MVKLYFRHHVQFLFFYCILFQFSICFLFCVRELRGDGDGDSGSTAVTIVKLQ